MFSLFKRWVARIKDGPVDWDELEATLIQSDLGVELSMRLLAKLQKEAVSAATIQQVVCNELLALWPGKVEEPVLIPNTLNVWLIVGVNGTGKTTTAAKLAAQYQKRGKKVFFVAADTFRAAAIDQLRRWAERLNVGIFCGKENGDPAAAAYEGIAEARAAGADLVLIDTAGRLHNKENLMRELEKVKRVIGKHDSAFPHHAFQVVDGTSGANTLSQAKIFHEAVPLSGLVVTKLDSSAKGGSIAALKEELGLNTIWIGKGEGVDDIELFNPETYVERFFGEEGKVEKEMQELSHASSSEWQKQKEEFVPQLVIQENIESQAPLKEASEEKVREPEPVATSSDLKSKILGWFGRKKN